MRFAAYILSLVVSSLLLATPVTAQEEDIETTRLYYTRDMSGGALVHTNGFGAFFRKSKRITGFKKRVLSAEIVNMKHAKEHKSFNPYNEDTKGFIYGKMNALTILRPSIGKQKTLYSKETKRGVQIGYIWLVGPSIGLLKPVYLDIARPTVVNPESVSTEKYDPNTHSIDMIYGRSPSTKGIEETRIMPGLHTKFGLNFEYAPEDEMIRAIEVGVNLDAYHKRVPIMAQFDVLAEEDQVKNHQFFVTLYIHWQIGKKFFQ